jgi:hypothetical protein
MKRYFFTLVIAALTMSCYSQKSVDDLFEKYSGKEGFVTVTISGDLVKIIRNLDDDEDDDQDRWPADITTIRILAQKDDGIVEGNFFDMVEKEIDRKNYEEFMTVKNYHHDLVMLVRMQGKIFKEFLIIAGDDDGEDNALIQIKGNMTYKEARDFADKMKEDNGAHIIVKGSV